MNLAQPTTDEVAWLAIRQPGVIRLLEQRLAPIQGDRFAAGLELACRIIASLSKDSDVPLARLTPGQLAAAVATTALDGSAPELNAWLLSELRALPVALTAHEEETVITTIAAIVCAAVGPDGTRP